MATLRGNFSPTSRCLFERRSCAGAGNHPWITPKNDNVTLANFLEKQGFADSSSVRQDIPRRGHHGESQELTEPRTRVP
jgi:hypothetical protein